MANFNKRNKENFNSMFRKIFRKQGLNNFSSQRSRMSVSEAEKLHRPLLISKFKLLSKETRKWHTKDPEGFSYWSRAWDKVFSLKINDSCDLYRSLKQMKDLLSGANSEEKISFDTSNSIIQAIELVEAEAQRKPRAKPDNKFWVQLLHELSYEYYLNVAKATGGFSEVARKTDKRTLENELKVLESVNTLLEKRREKITNKLKKKSLWSPGTLLQIKHHFKKSYYYLPETFTGFCLPTSLEHWNSLLSLFGEGVQEIKKNVFFSMLINDKVDVLPEEVRKKVKNLHPRFDLIRKVYDNLTLTGMVLNEVLVSFETETQQYAWIRFVHLLVDKQRWVLVLHPFLEPKDVKNWIVPLKKSISKKEKSKTETFHIETQNMREKLYSSLIYQSVDEHEMLVSKNEAYEPRKRKQQNL